MFMQFPDNEKIQKSYSFTVLNFGQYQTGRSLDLIELRPDQALMVYQKSRAYWRVAKWWGQGLYKQSLLEGDVDVGVYDDSKTRKNNVVTWYE